MIRGSAAATDFPNDVLVRAELGFIGFTWFGALNASARNSRDWPSRTWNRRVNPRSKLINPGPRNSAAFPYPQESGMALQMPVVCVGFTNALGFSQPSLFLLGRYASASIWFARPLSVVPVNVVSIPLVTRNAVPDISLRIPESCQPLNKRRNVLLANLGLSTTVDRFTMCSRSPEQVERLYFRNPGVIPPEPGCDTTPSPIHRDQV